MTDDIKDEESVSVTMRLPKHVVQMADRVARKLSNDLDDKVSRTAYIKSLILADAPRILNEDEPRTAKLL